MRSSLLTLFLVLMLLPLGAQQEAPLYPGRIPNSRDVPDPETMQDRGGVSGRAFDNTAVPTLTTFVPAHPNGMAVVVCPGGGYARTAFDKEGIRVAERLVRDSITVFVLKYRIPQDLTNVDKSLAPLQDAQQALRTVRRQAGKYGIDPQKIGILGFSAGGHLAATAATRFATMADANERDTTSVRPDFVGLLYPVISFDPELMHEGSRTNLIGADPSEADILRFSADRQVTADSPPAFLVHAADDGAVPVENSLAYYRSCLDHKIPAEMHLYAGGGHGFGLHNPTTPDDWMERFLHWLQTL